MRTWPPNPDIVRGSPSLKLPRHCAVDLRVLNIFFCSEISFECSSLQSSVTSLEARAYAEELSICQCAEGSSEPQLSRMQTAPMTGVSSSVHSVWLLREIREREAEIRRAHVRPHRPYSPYVPVPTSMLEKKYKNTARQD